MLVAQPVAMPLLAAKAAQAAERAPATAESTAMQHQATLAPAGPVCEDDELWRDPHGKDCKVYKRTIKTWGEQKVCREHLGGLGSIFCRATCGSCKRGDDDIKDNSPGCADNVCIGPWQVAYGRCYQCSDFAKGCTDPRYKTVFEAECPKTCGICKAPKPRPLVTKTAPSPSNCKDTDEGWCKDLGMDYCSEGTFAKKCPRTCELCAPSGAVVDACRDIFSTFTCSRYASYGWCDREDTKAQVRLRCPMTCGRCGVLSTSPPARAPPLPDPFGRSAAARQHGSAVAGLTLGVWLLGRMVGGEC